MERFDKVVRALEKTVRPTHVTRVGTRYVDHVPLKEGGSFQGMLKDEMMGMSGTTLGGNILHSISEIVCKVKEGEMLARWGMLPPRGSHDPEVMPPVMDASWFLDVDTFMNHQSSPIPFESSAIRASAFELATRSYAFFRWAVTEKFLQAFGGVTK